MSRENVVPIGSDLHAIANQLLAEGIGCSADRVVFATEAGYKFANVKVEQIYNVLREFKPSRYRLQRRVGARWRDVDPAKPIHSANSIARSVAIGRVAGLPPNDIVSAATVAPQKISVALIKYFRTLSAGVGKKFDSAAIAREIKGLDALSASGALPDAEFVRATLQLYKLLLDHGVQSTSSLNSNIELLRVSRKIEALNLPRGRESSVAKSLVLAKIYSLHDRESASALFEQAKSEGSDIIDRFYIDMGAFTYLRRGAVGTGVAERRMSDIVNSIEPASVRASAGKQAIVYSVDPKFFRIYAPTILFYAQQIPSVDFNVLVCAPPAEVSGIVEDSNEYIRALARLNHSGRVTNVHFYMCPVPDYVQDPKTFYACARFFGASVFAKCYENIHLLDADLTAVDNPIAHFQETATNVFGAVISSSFQALSPWRRVMAGNVTMSRAVLETGILQDLQAYISTALATPNSWMLDQNALSYAFEQNVDHVSDIGVRRRPFVQHPFRASWEANYKRPTARA